MFAKRVPARQWKNYKCDIAQYSEKSLARHPTQQSESTNNEKRDLVGKADGAGEERLEDVNDKV